MSAGEKQLAVLEELGCLNTSLSKFHSKAIRQSIYSQFSGFAEWGALCFQSSLSSL